MVSKKTSRGPVSKISSAAAPASAAATQNVQKSSILHSAFSPSEFQLALFASVIQSFDSQHLRIHDVNSGRLRCEQAVGSKIRIHSLDWGFLGTKNRHQHQQQSKKKRKRNETTNEDIHERAGQDAIVALATSDSDVKLFSPAEGRIVGTLTGAHERGVKSFKFTDRKPSEGWSIGGDGKLVQWDVQARQSLRTINLPNASIQTLAIPASSSPPILCASSTPYLISLEDGEEVVTSFDAFTNPIHSLLTSPIDLSGPSATFLAADSDRHIHVYDIKTKKLLRSLIADSEVEYLTLHTSDSSQANATNEAPAELLAVVTRDGLIEIFSQPFFNPRSTSNKAPTLKAQRRDMTRKANAFVKIIRPDTSGTVVPVFDASFQGSDLVVVWADGGVNLAFERVRWQDESNGALAFQGTKEIVRGKSNSGFASAVMEGVKDIGKSHVDESHTVVVDGGMTDDVAMEDAPQDGVSVPSDEEDDENPAGEVADPEGVKEDVDEDESDPEDADMENTETGVARIEDEDEVGEDEEPTFGDRLEAQSLVPINVADADLEGESRALIPKNTSGLQIPSGVSLSTVLSQSLRNNDNTLLESCFHTTDIDIIRATIQRLDTSLAPSLLQKLAERLARRPGRYGQLLVWVQWLCVAHGGAIAGRPDILKRFSSLFNVLDQRSRSLDNLLLLKGKLDMMDAQMGLRKEMQSRAIHQDSQDMENVIYIEGQEEADSSDEDDADDTIGSHTIRRPKKSLQDLADEDAEEEDDDDEAMPTVNGVASESDDEDAEEDGEDEVANESEADALVNEEAEESDAEGSHSSDEEGSSAEDSAEEADSFINDDSDLGEEEDEEVQTGTSPPPTKKSKLQQPHNNTPNGLSRKSKR